MNRQATGQTAQQEGDWHDRGMVSYRGKVQRLADWCRELGLDYQRTTTRLRNGWAVKDAFTTERSVCRRTAITIKGETKSVAAWCRHFGVRRWLYEKRVAEGMSPEGALTAAVESSDAKKRRAAKQ